MSISIMFYIETSAIFDNIKIKMENDPFATKPIKVLLIAQSKTRCEEANDLFFKKEKEIKPILEVTFTIPSDQML